MSNERLHGLREGEIPFADPVPGVVSRQPQRHPVPDIGDFGMMIDSFGLDSDPDNESESLGKIGKLECLLERIPHNFPARQLHQSVFNIAGGHRFGHTNETKRQLEAGVKSGGDQCTADCIIPYPLTALRPLL